MSPLIKNIAWGRMEIDRVGSGKDFKLWPGGGRPWDWRETDTHHVPGIQPADVEELLEHGARTVVLSRGMLLALQTCPETVELLDQEGVVVRRCETREAVRVYNDLARAGEPVAGLFHSTC